MNAQIDSRNNSISIPAVESPKDSSDSKSILPSKPIESPNTFKGLSTPKTTPQFNFPKKEFSMTGGEVFGNPGELYTKQLDKHIESTRLITPEEVEQRNGSRTDQFFGDFKSKSKFVNIAYRDHGAVDGDLIQVRVNDDVVVARVFLTNSFSGLKLDLKPGINKIDFVALNQGESGPNTAEFIVVDDTGNVVSSNQWNLATGVKATIILIKE
ncbi:hypothetical protein CSW08_00005 [Confluentibacter flavum]|uniref:Uncharacterized protein n=2 Tax=Confluentibacter flavum TaxID=1909700 RepID=A0A2N3HPV8_9FLAO|nr:hypothetical protein CSW08_00005 [Confluentibacter flavum]